MAFIVVIVLLLVSLLAACSPTTDKDPDKDPTKGPDDAPEDVTITLTGWRVEDKDAMDEMNKLFTQQYPHIKVVYNPVQATEYDSYLQTSLSNGTAEDIIMIRSFSGGDAVYGSGKIYDITAEEVPDLANFSAAALDAWTTDDGHTYAVPGTMTLEGVFYNKEIFEDCGITKAPETVPELLDACEAIKAKGYTVIAGGIKDAWYVSEEVTSSILMSEIGSGQWVEDLYAKKHDFTDGAFVRMLETLEKISAYYPEFYEGLTYEDCQALFLSGNAAMYMSGTFEIEYFQSTNPDMQLGCFAFPGRESASTAMNCTFVNGFGVNKDTKHKDEAFTYIKWLASVDGGTAYVNEVAGFLSFNTKVSESENAVVKDWLALREGREQVHMLGYEYITEEMPDYTTAVADAVYKLLVDGLSPTDAAAYMQDQVAWYFD